MPSTWSPNLRLELIATGEQSGAWGNTTNYNLGTLLEQAITGVGAITMPDTNLTLTASNGVTDQSRNAVLVFTSVVSLTANRNVIIASSPKVYIVSNLTTGGFALTIKTATGTGVAVANSYTAIVYCDGTNVTLVSPEYNTVTGDLAVPGSALINTNTTIGGSLTVTGNITLSGALTDTSGGGLAPTGTILDYAGSAAPTGWLLAYGQAVSRTTYANLYAILGTVYGAGDGSTTFNVPDLRGRTVFGKDDMGGTAANRITNAVSGLAATTLGAVGGDQNIPSHTHNITDPGHTTSISDPGHTHTVSITDPGHTHEAPTSGVAGNVYGAGPYNNGTPGLYGYMTRSATTGITATASSATTGVTGLRAFTGITINTAGTGTAANIPPAIILNKIIKT
jgi:microcystin-dependent protein